MEVSFQQKYRKYYIYRNEQSYYILCVNKFKDYCRILEIDRTCIDLKCKVLPEKSDFKRGLRMVGKLLAESKFDL